MIGVLGVGALGVAGVATAALIAGPGAEVETPVSAAVIGSGEGPGVLELGAVSGEADAVHFEFSCLSPGDFMLGGQGLAVTCDGDGLGEVGAWGLMPLDTLHNGAIEVQAGVGAQWQLTAWYVETERVPLAVNENGETYGIDSPELQPDLIQAQATNGRVGYVRRVELEQASGPQPTSPTDAAGQVPEGATIPVYQNDGETIIGEFVVG